MDALERRAQAQGIDLDLIIVSRKLLAVSEVQRIEKEMLGEPYTCVVWSLA